MTVLTKRFHLNGNTTDSKDRPLSLVISFVFYILAGLLCFDIREQCTEEWEDKLMELEMGGIWETVTKEKLQVQLLLQILTMQYEGLYGK